MLPMWTCRQPMHRHLKRRLPYLLSVDLFYRRCLTWAVLSPRPSQLLSSVKNQAYDDYQDSIRHD